MDEDYQNKFRYYLRWLIARVKGTTNYSKMLSMLHNRKFEWLIPQDAYRESDGRNLRRVFAEEKGFEISDEDLSYPASFLEVLVSLSDTMSMSVLHDESNPEGHPYLYFGEMMENCGLANYTNSYLERMSAGKADEFIGRICDKVMFRRYSRNGEGGLFPIHGSRKDQRKIELWYQMNEYILATGRG